MIICTVGGGGLLVGICQGLLAVGWQDVPILAVEDDQKIAQHFGMSVTVTLPPGPFGPAFAGWLERLVRCLQYATGTSFRMSNLFRPLNRTVHSKANVSSE